jgi:hypothetical protein
MLQDARRPSSPVAGSAGDTVAFPLNSPPNAPPPPLATAWARDAGALQTSAEVCQSQGGNKGWKGHTVRDNPFVPGWHPPGSDQPRTELHWRSRCNHSRLSRLHQAWSGWRAQSANTTAIHPFPTWGPERADRVPPDRGPSQSSSGGSSRSSWRPKQCRPADVSIVYRPAADGPVVSARANNASKGVHLAFRVTRHLRLPGPADRIALPLRYFLVWQGQTWLTLGDERQAYTQTLPNCLCLRFPGMGHTRAHRQQCLNPAFFCIGGSRRNSFIEN